MTHSSVVLNQIRFGVRREVYGLPLAQTIVGRERFSPLFRPESESLLVHVQRPELDDRTIREWEAAHDQRFAESRLADDQRTVMVLKRTSEQLAASR